MVNGLSEWMITTASMFPPQAIFIAHGPAFRKGYVSGPFANIEPYNLMCGELTSVYCHSSVILFVIFYVCRFTGHRAAS